MTDRDTKAMMQAFVDILNTRMKLVEARTGTTNLTVSGADFPAPVVNNQVQTPNVHVVNDVSPAQVNVTVDTAPLTTLVEKYFMLHQATLAQMVEEFREKNEMLSQLIQVFAAQQPPTVKNIVKVPEAVQQEKPKRELQIEFDGNHATVKEV